MHLNFHLAYRMTNQIIHNLNIYIDTGQFIVAREFAVLGNSSQFGNSLQMGNSSQLGNSVTRGMRQHNDVIVLTMSVCVYMMDEAPDYIYSGSAHPHYIRATNSSQLGQPGNQLQLMKSLQLGNYSQLANSLQLWNSSQLANSLPREVIMTTPYPLRRRMTTRQ